MFDTQKVVEQEKKIGHISTQIEFQARFELFWGLYTTLSGKFISLFLQVILTHNVSFGEIALIWLKVNNKIYNHQSIWKLPIIKYSRLFDF